MQKKKQDGSITTALLEVLAGRFIWLYRTIYVRDISMPAGSRAREEGMQRGNLIEITSKPPGRPKGWWDIYVSVAILAQATWAQGVVGPVRVM